MNLLLLVVIALIEAAYCRKAPAGGGDGKMTDSEARKVLKRAEISVDYPEPKTSLANINKGTIAGVIQIKERSDCKMVVTGGTEEIPHGDLSEWSHVNGYKLDIRVDACLNKYIFQNAVYDHVRASGAKVYILPDGTECARYDDSPDDHHWDILPKV